MMESGALERRSPPGERSKRRARVAGEGAFRRQQKQTCEKRTTQPWGGERDGDRGNRHVGPVTGLTGTQA